MTWRPLTAADLPAVAALQAHCHGALAESPALFAARLRDWPAGCFAAPGGYAIAHPVRRDRLPRLDEVGFTIPADADALHLHDVALAPAARGRGLVGALLMRLDALARDHALPVLTLVAVHGTGPLWARHGFAAGGAVAGYGPEACAMARPVSAMG